VFLPIAWANDLHSKTLRPIRVVAVPMRQHHNPDPAALLGSSTDRIEMTGVIWPWIDDHARL
jgi:hypothetical protein